MKTIVILAVTFIALFTTASHAADPVTHKYTAEVAGVMCSACSDKVKVAFQSMPGVKSVKVKKGEKPAVARVEIESTSAKLTKEAAMKSLGDNASSYNVLNFKLAGS